MTETILVVDDEDSVRRTFQEWLEGAALDCRILTAEDSVSALRQANESRIDLAILDWNLGAGNDGLQLLEDLQVFHPDVVAIMITGFADQATPVQAMRMGVRDYLDKNQDLNRNTFLRAVRNQLDRIRPARREREIQQNLREFHDTLEKVLPLIQTTSTLQETTPFADVARTLLRAMQVSTQARSGYLILFAENEPVRGHDQHGNPIDLPPVTGGYALSQQALTFQGAVVVPDLPILARRENLVLFPHQMECQTMLAVPLTVTPQVRAVLELFDPLDSNGAPASFRVEDCRLVSALAPLAEDLLRQSINERQTRRMLLNAIQTALQSSRSLADSLQPEPRPEDPLSPAILDTIRQGLSDSPDATQMVRLAEGIRILSMRFGPAAIQHCIHLVESLRTLLETTLGPGEPSM